MASLLYENKTIEINSEMKKCSSHRYIYALIKYGDGSVVCPIHYFRTKPKNVSIFKRLDSKQSLFYLMYLKVTVG